MSPSDGDVDRSVPDAARISDERVPSPYRTGTGDRLVRYFRSHPERADRLTLLVSRLFRHRHQFVKWILYSLLGKVQPVFLDYDVKERHRFGYDRPPHAGLHELIDAGRERYASLLQSFLDLSEPLAEIPSGLENAGPDDPMWVNDWFGGLDGVALYGLLALNDPRRFVEVGSGMSTKFARRAIRDHGLRTRITSIDPEPRANIDRLCDEVIRSKLEDLDLNALDQLAPGDILFMDGSHRAFMNTDVTVFFLEVLPALSPGVFVEIHDIMIPNDYPPAWAGRYYSEQYLLAAYLLGGGRGVEIVFPSAFVAADTELSKVLAPLWEDSRMTTTTPHGSSFWMRTVAR